MIFTLSSAIKHKDREITQLELNLESLTGQQLIEVEQEFSLTRPNFTGILETNKEYLILVAAKALKMPSSTLINLGAKDFTKLSLVVMSFLLA